MQPNDIAALQSLALSHDSAAANTAFTDLTAIGTNEGVQFYLHLLESDKANWRNKAASGLAQIADPQAIEPLLRAIQKPEARNRNGTLVYALTSFDCRHLLKELFLIVFYQGYEAQLMALIALEDQEFEYSAEDVEFVRQHWHIASQAPSSSLAEFGLTTIGEMIEEL
ncbi:hypothetical protein GCM10022408_22190 [Hymenobacter fastidiosus]|uniref:HEAT repeat domain-containing protein n=1 Tax=Hymenobacter fastidiosus TaxID=486264 RepID=A0ABP7SC34_9BACT